MYTQVHPHVYGMCAQVRRYVPSDLSHTWTTQVSTRQHPPSHPSYHPLLLLTASHTWTTQVVWGLLYSREQALHDVRAVRLVQIMQYGE